MKKDCKFVQFVCVCAFKLSVFAHSIRSTHMRVCFYVHVRNLWP